MPRDRHARPVVPDVWNRLLRQSLLIEHISLGDGPRSPTRVALTREVASGYSAVPATPIHIERHMRPVHFAFALFALVVAASAAARASAAPAVSGTLVRTQQGWVQGFASGDLERFRGVPYAVPPRRRPALAAAGSTETLCRRSAAGDLVRGAVRASARDRRPSGPERGLPLPQLSNLLGSGLAAGAASSDSGFPSGIGVCPCW
jgi:hypothetical protein